MLLKYLTLWSTLSMQVTLQTTVGLITEGCTPLSYFQMANNRNNCSPGDVSTGYRTKDASNQEIADWQAIGEYNYIGF